MRPGPARLGELMGVAFMSSGDGRTRPAERHRESIASVYGFCRSCKVGSNIKLTRDTENPREKLDKPKGSKASVMPESAERGMDR